MSKYRVGEKSKNDNRVDSFIWHLGVAWFYVSGGKVLGGDYFEVEFWNFDLKTTLIDSEKASFQPHKQYIFLSRLHITLQGWNSYWWGYGCYSCCKWRCRCWLFTESWSLFGLQTNLIAMTNLSDYIPKNRPSIWPSHPNFSNDIKYRI